MTATVQTWPEEPRPLNGGWVLTASGLLSPCGKAFCPSCLLSVPDVARMRGIKPQTLNAYIFRGNRAAGSGWMRVGTNGGWAILAADAVRL